MKITESENGQIYPEDTFSHGAAHIISEDKLSFLHIQKASKHYFKKKSFWSVES